MSKKTPLYRLYTGIPNDAVRAYADSVANGDGAASIATLMNYQCNFEQNGGIIRDAANRDDAWWARNFKLIPKHAEILRTSISRPPFWHWEGDNLYIDFYVRELEKSNKRISKRGKKGGDTTAEKYKAKKAHRQAKADPVEDDEEADKYHDQAPPVYYPPRPATPTASPPPPADETSDDPAKQPMTAEELEASWAEMRRQFLEEQDDAPPTRKPAPLTDEGLEESIRQYWNEHPEEYAKAKAEDEARRASLAARMEEAREDLSEEARREWAETMEALSKPDD